MKLLMILSLIMFGCDYAPTEHDHDHDHSHGHYPYPHAEHPFGPVSLRKSSETET